MMTNDYDNGDGVDEGDRDVMIMMMKMVMMMVTMKMIGRD
jgi:hypothetical protein